jgi:TolB-like protein/DNA-binding winged helix-turn-helix (wHTH) protein/tetratricopeptide (TPR) repeat protein
MKAMDSPALRIGAWRADSALDEISKDGNTVKLEPRAMQLLLYLAGRAGQVVSVEQLLDQVWAGVVVTPDSVYHAVAALRRVLGDDTHDPTYIANVPRRGYRLVAPVAAWVDAPPMVIGSSPSPAADPARSAAEPDRPAKESARAAAPVAKPAPPWRRAAIVIAVLFAAALGYLVIDKFWRSTPVTMEHPVTAANTEHPAIAVKTAIAEKSIAVLPFVDMSEKKDQEYFADGMAEDIINLLANVPDLHVPARTSSFYFKGKSTKVPDIARELGVAHVLEGSIRRSGNQLRVTAQLVRADTGYSLWSQSYDRDLRDVFKVQDDIANSVVQALRITLMGGPLTRQRGGTQNLEAYQLSLRARSLWNQNTKPSLEAADGYLDQAIKLDPDFARALNAKAVDAMLQVEIEALPPKEGYERARRLAQRALQLSPDLAEAHFMLAYIHRSYDWDWAAAQAELRQGLSIDPTDAIGLMYVGVLSKTLGHWDDAERQIRASLDRDPLWPFAHYNLGATLYLAGRFAEAEGEFRRLQKLAPGFSWSNAYLGKVLLAEGKADAALAMARQESNEEYRLSMLPIFLQAVGHKGEAGEALKKVATNYADSEAFNIAMVYAYRNEHELALRWLDRAYEQKDPDLIEILGEPLLKNLADDPGYKAFLRKMNLAQ